MTKDAWWWDRRSCWNADPRIFDEKDTRKDKKPDWRLAHEVCGPCPVKAECLDFVLQIDPGFHGERYYAADMTPDQIEKARKKRRASR